MRINLSPSNASDYELFLKIKELPRCRFIGRTAEFPDEYASLLGVKSASAPDPCDYIPLPSLFDYQKDISRIAIRRKKFSVFARPGLGKTLIQSEFARHAAKSIPSEKCVMMVAPPMVIDQTLQEIEHFYGDSFRPAHVESSDLPNWLKTGGSKVGITSWNALNDELIPGKIGAVVADECFAKGTMVDMVIENGEIYQNRIENVLRGDRMVNASGVDTVSDIHRREVQYAVAVEYGKTRVIASPNHPFFTQRGWVGAQELEPGDSILRTAASMRMVRDAIFTKVGVRSILQSVLLSEMADEQPGAQGESTYHRDARKDWSRSFEVVPVGHSGIRGGIGEDSRIESNEESRDAVKGEPTIERNEARTFRAWGERTWFDGATKDHAGCVTEDLGCGVLFVTGEANSGLSIALQARLSRSRTEARNRGGWSLPSIPEGSGFKERPEGDFIRVDSVEVLEPGHPELESIRDAEGKLYFYDLGGTRHPSFSIGGCLVHNSSVMKSAYGKQGSALIKLSRGLEYKLAATGTPAPNDRIEYANHAVFMDAFPTVNAFLARFFVNRGETQNRWEMKPHALRPFYRALSHWCIFLNNPATYGWKDNVATIPPVRIQFHNVDMTASQAEAATRATGTLFGMAGGITSRGILSQIAKGHYRGESIPTNKPEYIRSLVGGWPSESTIIWCLYNSEQDSMERVFPEAASMRGATKHSDRMRMIADFKSGRIKTIISKPDVMGFGLNLQIASRMVFSGIQDSWEDFFQCICRANRVGSTRELNVHIPLTHIEQPMAETVMRKAKRIEEDTAEQEALFKEEGLLV